MSDSTKKRRAAATSEPKPDREARLRARAERKARAQIRAAQAAVRADIRAKFADDDERRARAHRLIVTGATLESKLGREVDDTLLAGVIEHYVEVEADPERAAEIRARAAERAAAEAARREIRCREHRWRVYFPAAPPIEVREALKRAGYSWKREPLNCWIGDNLPDDLDARVRASGGSIVEVTPEP